MSHLSVVMTTDGEEMSETTGEKDVTSSSSRGAAVYFETAVLIIGVMGTAANGLVLYALVASKQHNKHVLIVSQNALDLYSCMFLIITYGLKLFNIHLSGLLGHWLCMLILNESLLWCGVYGSFCNLTVIAIERYLRVVHPVWSRNHLRKWMIYAAMIFVWISAFAHQLAVAFMSSAVIDGACYGYVIWKNPATGVAYGIFYFLAAYAVVLVIFLFCYGKILMAIRRQEQVMAAYGSSGQSTAQIQLNRIQSNVIKTMVLVCAFYAIAWLPENIYFLLMSLNLNLTLMMSYGFTTYFTENRSFRGRSSQAISGLVYSEAPNLTLLDSAYYSVLFIAFLYVCANPFIYATKFDPVRRILIQLILCKKTQEPADGSVDTYEMPNIRQQGTDQ